MTRDRDETRAMLEAGANSAPEAPAPRTRSEQSRTSGAKSRGADETARLERPDLDHWAPPNRMEIPSNDEHWVYRWIAEYVNGQHMPNRMNRARREGYAFVRIDELPEGFFVDEDIKGDGLARSGGLVLARLPRRFAEQRKQYYARRSAEALRGANELQGVAGRDAFEENRGTRSLDGRAAGEALRSMSRGSA